MTERRTRRVIAENATPIKTAHGDEQPWAVVVEDLTWEEVERLRDKAPLDKASYPEAMAIIARYVLDWNIPGRNADTEELEPIAPPAEDAKAFRCVEPWVISWLFMTMHTVHLGGAELQKKPTPINGTPDSKKESA